MDTLSRLNSRAERKSWPTDALSTESELAFLQSESLMRPLNVIMQAGQRHGEKTDVHNGHVTQLLAQLEARDVYQEL